MEFKEQEDEMDCLVRPVIEESAASRDFRVFPVLPVLKD